MRDAAREMGLSDETANALVYQTAAGAAELAISSEEDVSELRRNVTSPGGTTERALNMFEEGKLKELVERALHAARDRSIELANEFGNK
jgi:pyrroline-5-carboxylate reductase